MIEGTITDESGGVLPGVTVTLKNAHWIGTYIVDYLVSQGRRPVAVTTSSKPR